MSSSLHMHALAYEVTLLETQVLHIKKNIDVSIKTDFKKE